MVGPLTDRRTPTLSAGVGGARPPALLLLALLGLVLPPVSQADIPAAPVMTLYRFNGDLELPYYDLAGFESRGASGPAGTLVQGTSLIPCLVVRGGRALTDASGTPFVGFEVIVDPRRATAESTAQFRDAVARRKALRVQNHHCGPQVRRVIDVRNLYALEKAPFFDPPGSGAGRGRTGGDPDAIVRAFHNSPQCAAANRELTERRRALQRAWDAFSRDSPGRWSEAALAKARHLDYTMRTALFEGHLERGCNAYGACERNIVALSIRNRARERCLARQGCRAPGDFAGVASMVSQYNIWDEYLTQISGLTACFLRDDLASRDYYAKLQAMYDQNQADVQRILFGTDADLAELFPGTALGDLKRMAHYYHAPAMGKCFPQHDRVEYISGAVARQGEDLALIANSRIKVDEKIGEGYRFRTFRFEEADERDIVEIRDDFPGFVIDGRKVSLKPASGCQPYGIPAGCRHEAIGRYRRTPSWLGSGKPLELSCRIQDRGERCDRQGGLKTARVGGVCDTQMRPVAGVD